MVNKPRTRHSKAKREPVTIDLEAEAVKRDSEFGKEAETGQPGHRVEADQAQAESPVSPEAEQPAGGETGEPVDETAPFDDDATTETGTAHEPAAGAGSASREGTGRALVGGVAGGIVALVLAGALQWADVIPVPGGAAPVETLRQDVEAMMRELSQLREAASTAPSGEAVEQALAEPRQQIAALQETVAGLQETVSSGAAGGGTGSEALEARLSELESRLNEVAQRAGEAEGGTGLAERVTSDLNDLRQTVTAASQAASANAERLEALSGQVRTLAEQVEAEDEGPRLALVVSASALRSAVERGAPFAGELETYSALAPNAPELEPLRQYAQTGIPTRAELARQAPEVASRIAAAASSPPANAGFLDRLMASARSAVTVRPVGQVEGETPAAIAARMEAAVLAGDYERALSEYEALPPGAREAASAFAQKLRARQAADRVLEQALSDALKPA